MSFKFKKEKKENSHPIGYINFENLVGSKADLYYHNHSNQFQLGNMVFEVIEDENDGYRSSMDHVEIVSVTAPKRQKIASIEIKKWDTGSELYYQLTDENGFVWVEFGTNYVDDYYPCFIFRTFVQ